MSKSRFIESPGHYSQSKLLSIIVLSQTERGIERERERESPWGGSGGRVVRWCWVNFQCRGVLLIRIIIGQGPLALAVGAGGVFFFWTFFSSLSFLFSFSLFGRRPDIV